SNVSGDHALRQRRDQACLRRRQWIRARFDTWYAHEAISTIHQIEHRWNHERARNYTDHERNLLLPRRGIDELPSLEVLEVVVRDRSHIENRSEERRVGKERGCKW